MYSQNERVLQQIHLRIAAERNRQDSICGGPKNDDTNTQTDWLGALVRQLGLATGETAHEGCDDDRWERQMIRVMATAQAALESLYRKHPERVGRVAGRPEGSGY